MTSSTVITKGGQTVAVDALKVGDQIRFSQTRNADGTYTITAIVVPTPVAGGEVTAVDATTITVKGKGGATRVITVNGATVYKLGSAAGSKADVKVGVRVAAQGTVSGDTFTAITVRIQPAEIGGIVTGKTGDSITVKRGDGSTAVIHVTSKTTYEHKGKDAATLADVAVGDRVSAEGTLRADGSIDATSVEGQAPKVKKPAAAASAAPWLKSLTSCREAARTHAHSAPSCASRRRHGLAVLTRFVQARPDCVPAQSRRQQRGRHPFGMPASSRARECSMATCG